MRLPSSHINHEKHCNSQIKSRTFRRPFAYKQWSKDAIRFASGESAVSRQDRRNSNRVLSNTNLDS